MLVTGANGCIGSAIAERLDRDGQHYVIRAVRKLSNASSRGKPAVEVGDLEMGVDWSAALQDVAVVVHTAARVHQMSDRDTDSVRSYQRVNTEATLALARQAAEARVSRFIFVSTVKVLGEASPAGQAFHADDARAPVGAYAESKAAAEAGLSSIAKASGMAVTVIRPPLVYGPDVRGNFERLVRSIERGLPLPLGGIENLRSLVCVDNLVDLLIACVDHPRAANETFLASDGEDLSTPALVRRLAAALGRPPRLFTIPRVIVNAAAALLGKRASVARLFESLRVDIAKNDQLLGWRPPIRVDAAFAGVARSRIGQAHD